MLTILGHILLWFSIYLAIGVFYTWKVTMPTLEEMYELEEFAEDAEELSNALQDLSNSVGETQAYIMFYLVLSLGFPKLMYLDILTRIEEWRN